MPPVQAQKNKGKQESDRSHRKRIRYNPTDCTKIVIKIQNVISCRNHIYILQELHKNVLSWHHHYLYHPDATRM